jgi:hypothetical protein
MRKNENNLEDAFISQPLGVFTNYWPTTWAAKRRSDRKELLIIRYESNNIVNALTIQLLESAVIGLSVECMVIGAMHGGFFFVCLGNLR